MDYKVLYRKYRPLDFENIIGQDYIIQTLKNSIKMNNISHAYIFSGPRGTGKTSTAKVFAKAINCLNPVDGAPCNNCEFCLNFKENPDIIEIDAASNNGVNEIRNLIDNIKLTPSNGKYKVYIIDEVHMMTTSAFNALLLTLEEPPKHAVFILATTNIENVPVTVLSRCQRYDFKKIDENDISKRLKYICEQENIAITDDAIKEIAGLSDGGMRDALSLLDQLSKSDKEITLDSIEEKMKIVSNESINSIYNAIENNDLSSMLSIIDDFAENGVNYKFLVKKLVSYFFEKLKDIKLGKINSRLGYQSYKKIILDLTDSLNKINVNVDSFINLEVILMEYFDVVNEEKKLLNNDLKINDNIPGESISKKNSNNTDDVNDVKNNQVKDFSNLIKIRVNNCFVDAQKKYLEEYKDILQKILNSADLSSDLRSLLIDANLVVSSENYLVLSCETKFMADSCNSRLTELEQLFNKFTSDVVKIIFISNEEWQVLKNEYIKNLRNKVKYKIIDEKDLENNVEDDTIINVDFKNVDDIFENIEVV